MLSKPSLPAILTILLVYLCVTILIGWLARRHGRNANSYLATDGLLPLWIVVAAYLAANCGALEIVGLSAMAAQYGVQAFHFYWIGAIPAMVFLAIWMMPVYRRSGVTSVPEYLDARYGPSVRMLNAWVIAVTMILFAGISLYAMAQVLEVVVGLHFTASIVLCAGVVLTYVFLGGLRATIYNEVFQLFIMLVGLVPLAIRSAVIHASLSGSADNMRDHLWRGLPTASDAAPLDRFGIIFGLGCVLSFGYWCTDFVLMQRAFSARTEAQARQVPLLVGFGKLLFSVIVVVPGLVAYHLFPDLGFSRRFDQALPSMMTTLCGPLTLGLGVTALVASLMSGLAANVSAFASVWTNDLYRAHFRKHESERHYLTMGRVATIVAVLLSIAASSLNFLFRNLMEQVQLIFSVFGAPFWAMFLLGALTRRTTTKGALAGFLSGSAIALWHTLAFMRGWIRYGSVMNANFHAAIYAFVVAVLVGWFVSLAFASDARREGASTLAFAWLRDSQGPDSRLLWFLSICLLLGTLVLNWMWS